MIVHNCGYGMGGKRFAEQCKAMGIVVDEDEAKRIVGVYREKNNKIAQYWRDVEQDFLEMVRGTFNVGIVELPLPSGRRLVYHNPRIIQRETPWGAMRDTAQVDTLNSVTRQWTSQIIWGGLLTENVVQATARDIMATAMMQLEVKGYNVVLSVHDEIICEVPDDFGSIQEMIDIMITVPGWAEGCPINAEGQEGKRYRK
jgi:DNA polymerase